MFQRGSTSASRARPTVKILEKRSGSQAAKISLLAGTAAALILILAFRIWQTREHGEVFQRTLADIVLDWRCEQGHAFQMQGQLGPGRCPVCGSASTPVGTYVCTTHGSYEVAVRFAHRADGAAYLSAVRIADQAWTTPDKGLRCPRCDRILVRPSPNPLAAPKSARP